MSPTDNANFYLELLRAYIDSANDAFFVLCDEMKFHVSNKRTENWLGQSEEVLTAHNRRVPITEFLGNKESEQKFIAAFEKTLKGHPTQIEFLIEPEKALSRWIEINMNKVNIEDGDLVICVARDVTSKREQTAALEHLALNDPLTNLPNRAQLRNILDDLIQKPGQKTFSMVLLDLDLFKEINDTLGHQVGDIFLQQIALRIVSATSADATVARFGGDEFAVVLPDLDEEQTSEAAKSILKSLQYPFSMKAADSNLIEKNTELSLGISVSMGVASFPLHASSTETLLRRTEIAMYQAKKAHVDLAIYSAEKDQHNVARLTLLGELQHGIETRQLLLNFQPIVDVRKGKLVSTEILIRWQHPERGLVAPDLFIPLAEQTGLIKPLTWWALDTGLQQCAEWKSKGLNPNISINISPHTLYDLELVNRVVDLLDKWSIDANKLILEITESAVMADSERALEIFRQLNNTGVQLAIDDFGTGHSSLGYLKRLPVDIIKIDKSFVISMLNDKSDAMIVRTIIDLAHNLGLKVTAEGVEKREMNDALAALGCDYAQGFHFGYPVAAEMFDKSFKHLFTPASVSHRTYFESNGKHH